LGLLYEFEIEDLPEETARLKKELSFAVRLRTLD